MRRESGHAHEAGLVRTGRVWLVAATTCGLVHAGFSALWAVGSDLLLETVGEVAGRVSALGPLRQGLLLGGIAVVKAGPVLGLVLDAKGLLGTGRARRLVRGGELVVGAGLAVYGLASMTVSGVWLVAEVGRPDGDPATVTALWGRLVIWDPLFALWGAGTLGYLATSSEDAPVETRGRSTGFRRRSGLLMRTRGR